jgi:poly [ADP-ribose] polymerase
MKKVKLIQVTDANNNKYYDMEQISDTRFVVHYGRVDKTQQTEEYSMEYWNKKYKEKIKKGYQDVTHLYVTDVKADSLLTSNEELNEVLRYLIKVSRTSFSQAYSKDISITPVQITEAQGILNAIANNTDIEQIRQLYLKLFMTIPRQMSNVKDYLPLNIEQAKDLVVSEQATLDNASIQNSFVSTGEEALLDKLEIEMEMAGLNDEIVRLLNGNESKVKRVISLRKPKTYLQLEDFTTKANNKKRLLAWHGTTEQNVLSICALSLQVRPTSIANGSMLGVAAYLSDDFEKSNNYIRGNRKFIFIFDAHVGNELVADTRDKIKQYALEELERNDFDSVYAPKGVNTGWANLRASERTIYRSEQLSPRYLLELNCRHDIY